MAPAESLLLRAVGGFRLFGDRLVDVGHGSPFFAMAAGLYPSSRVRRHADWTSTCRILAASVSIAHAAVPDDRAHGGVVARDSRASAIRDVPPGALPRRGPRRLRRARARRPGDRRDGGADDVLPPSAQPAWPVAKNEDSRARLSLRIRTVTKAGLGRQFDLVDADFGEPLAVAGQLANPLLGLVLEDQDLLVFGLA